MIPALLHGKLTFKQENMEDVLTSNVFGTLKYVRPERGLLPFLAQAKTIEGLPCPLGNLASQSVSAQYDFWPKWEHCEPDVVLDIRGSSRYLVAVEAKYWSGKSSKAAEASGDSLAETDEDGLDEGSEEAPDGGENVRRPSDQLAREWTDLVVEASKLGAQPILAYLTADLNCPREEILDSLNDCGKPVPGSPSPMIYWLSWRELPRLFRYSTDHHLLDLASLSDKMKLTFFEGIGPIAQVLADWTFQGPLWRFDMVPINECKWRFKQ